MPTSFCAGWGSGRCLRLWTQRRREAAAGHRTAEKPGGEQAHWRRGAVSKGRSEEGAAEGPPALYSATLLGALDELFHCLLLLPAVLCQACGPQI
jgi:hypothetical protein